MKVNNTPGSDLIKAYQSHAATGVDATRTERTSRSAPNQADTVNISDKAVLFREIQQEVSASPEVRPDRVQSARQNISKGCYAPDYRSIAEKLIHPDLGGRI